ncbi:hypothetical protein CSA08_04275 [Candidatus Gracilibacteria bacterium]|nr:MAG: hypothetical protein CSA08_04275 [Candidatus Gracilibacteria bacterium]
MKKITMENKELLNKLPLEFLDRLKLIYSEKELEILKEGFTCKKRKPTFRINTLKTTNKEVEDYFGKLNLKIQKYYPLENGYILINGTEKDLWNTKLNDLGKIYVQGLSSQIPVTFMDLKDNFKVLDLTASPGSKTTQISSKMANKGEVVAVDINKIRIDKLNFTIKRQGAKNITVIKADSRFLKDINDIEDKKFDDLPVFSPGYFDSILFDAPCSSEGRINLNNEKIWKNWTLGNIKRNYKIQKDILRNNLDLLKVGGELIYSTCTLSPEENEGIVHFLLCNYPELEIIDISSDSKISNSKKGILKFGDTVYKKEVEKSLRIIPNEESEGFFVAKFIKKSI